jgi:signal transduction histidine kinase/ActR/RegA family two-component response regulator
VDPLATHTFIREHRDDIIHEWEALVAAEPREVKLVDSALRDHLPEFLDELAAWLERSEAPGGARMRTVASLHAAQRLDNSFQLKQLIHEYRLLRMTILRLLLTAEAVEQERSIIGRAERVMELARLNAGLDFAVSDAIEHFVEERERKVLELQDRETLLRESDQRKSAFLAMLSHELRNPLAPIRHSLHLLDHAEAGSEQAARARAVLRRQTDHLTRLVEDVLDVTRISRGNINVQKTRLDLLELVRRTVEDHNMLFSTRGVAFDLHLGELPLWIDADATRMAQAIGNLLSNAAKFSNASGSVVITVERGAGGMALVRVKDDGVGIEAGLLPHIFEPFIQADTSLDRSRGGLGLGLALVKGLVDLHGGSVEARSDGPGRGAEFIIQLWLAPEQRVLRDSGRTTTRDGTARRRVLIIEDNVDAADSLREVLKTWQHETEVAHDGRTGVEKAHAFRPDIILCDIGLPEMDGYEVARAIRSDPTLASVFLVAVTGYASPGDQRKAAEAGFNRHLGKPVSVDAIEEVVATAPKFGRSAAG